MGTFRSQEASFTDSPYLWTPGKRQAAGTLRSGGPGLGPGTAALINDPDKAGNKKSAAMGSRGRGAGEESLDNVPASRPRKLMNGVRGVAQTGETGGRSSRAQKDTNSETSAGRSPPLRVPSYPSRGGFVRAGVGRRVSPPEDRVVITCEPLSSVRSGGQISKGKRRNGLKGTRVKWGRGKGRIGRARRQVGYPILAISTPSRQEPCLRTIQGRHREVNSIPAGKGWDVSPGSAVLLRARGGKQGHSGCQGGSIALHRNHLQSTMVKSKDKSKAKRLYELTPNKEATNKVARTDEQEHASAGVSRRSLETKGSPERQLLADLFDTQDIPTTPSRTEADFRMDIGLEPREQRITRVRDTQAQEGTPEEASIKNEPPSQSGGEGLGALLEAKAKDVAEFTEEVLDWRIPATFRLDWMAARVDQMLIHLDVVGGLYEPIFIEADSSPVKLGVKAWIPDPVSPKKETLSFFKIRIKNTKAKSLQEGLDRPRYNAHTREEVREDMIRVIEVLNQSKGEALITCCLGMLGHIRKIQARQNTFAGKASGGLRLEKLWDYGLRKLVQLAADIWGMQTAWPVLPLLRTTGVGTTDIAISDLFLNKFDDKICFYFVDLSQSVRKHLVLVMCSNTLNV